MHKNLLRGLVIRISETVELRHLNQLYRNVEIRAVQRRPKFQQTQRLYCQSTRPCWNCHEEAATKELFFCGNCGSLREVNNKQDFFDLLDVKVQHDVNSTDLTKKFRQLQSVLHPDKFSQKSSHEQSMSLEWSSFINNAYNTLAAPLNRGIYILNQNGIIISEENSSVDTKFLMEMMELNEAVDDAETPAEIIAVEQQNQQNLDQCAAKLNDALKDSDLELAKMIIIQMKYFTSVANSIRNKCNSLGVVK